MATVADMIDCIEKFAPLHLAADWDNVGLLLGDRNAVVHRVITCLTVTPEVVAEAIAENAQLIVAHHPILFRSVKRLTTGNPEGRMLLDLVRAGVAVYSPHTAYDNSPGGINDQLARKLSLTEVAALRRSDGEKKCKIVVFVPENDGNRVADAMFAAGAGRIGLYSQCSFRLPGKGTFFGSEDANPAVGQKGRREEVDEWRLEVLCPETSVEQVIAAMRREHSYEEPAYDVYPLQSPPSAAGEGRLGRLPRPLPLEEFARTVKDRLLACEVQMIGVPDQPINRVAVVCGAGGEFLSDAIRARADVLLTGEMRFHDYLAAQAQGIALVLPGHYATERLGAEALATHLQTQQIDVHVWASRRERDPVRKI